MNHAVLNEAGQQKISEKELGKFSGAETPLNPAHVEHEKDCAYQVSRFGEEEL